MSILQQEVGRTSRGNWSATSKFLMTRREVLRHLSAPMTTFQQMLDVRRCDFADPGIATDRQSYRYPGLVKSWDRLLIVTHISGDFRRTTVPDVFLYFLAGFSRHLVCHHVHVVV
jgi:hypothetical protein